MKKLLSIVLTICLMLTFTPLGVFNLTANALTSGYFTYTVSNNEATITGCDTSISGDVIIPDTLDGYPVTSIGNSAFSWRSKLTSVTIPEGVTSIGDTAFRGCGSLISINIPDSVTSIGASAFSSCSNLTSITVDENNTEYCSMDDVLFNKNKTELICYPASKTGFEYTIPDSVTSIGASAFDYCSSLLKITIPDGVTSIGASAFSGCSSLLKITIPDGVTSIGASAFSGCSNLISITLPDGVTSIGNHAFRNCSSLTSITIPNGVTSIGNDEINSSVFSGCSSLTSITIPDSVTFIGQFTFLNCSSLKNVYITDIAKWWEIDFSGGYSNPLYYGAKLYLNNELVTNLTIPDGVTSIGVSAFDGCSSLTSITIPDSVTSISIDAFEDCSSLTSIDVSLENTVYSSVDGVLFNKNKTELLRYPVGKTATAYTIPNSVTSVGDYAFYGCSGLTNITIPNSVTNIREYAFYGCSGLTNITIPDSVTSIREYAFRNCSSLLKITIPDGVTSIGASAFSGCSNLTSIVISEGIIVIEESTFSGCYNLKEIFLPKGLQLIKKYNFNSCSKLTDIYYGGIQEEWANITILQNNNYLNTANIHCYDSISVNGKEENVKWDDENKPILPKGYTDEQNKHFAIIGWTDKDGNEIDTSTLTVDNMIPLTAVVAEIPVDPTMLEADLIPTNDPYLPTGNKYINGFYVQGTQIRVPSADENIVMGLRFVNILDNNLLGALKEGATDVSYGTLVMLKRNHNGGEVTLDTKKVAKVEGTNTFKYASEFNNQYLKYTVAVTGINEEYFTEKFVIRPYISFTYNGNVVTLYGEQYEGASLYSAAKLAVAPDSIEDQNAKSWIQENIVNVVEKIGDNDVPSDDIFN